MICKENSIAKLRIFFCLFQQIALFTHIEIDDETYSTDKNYIDIVLKFDDLESELAKKICFIELFYFENGKKISRKSYVEIYPGYNEAYCFIDCIGTSYQIILYKKEIKKFFKENKFEISSEGYLKKIQVNLNFMNLNDRANLILINCINGVNIKFNDDMIYLNRLITLIKDFDLNKSYMLSFNNNDFKTITYRDVRPVNRLNFNDIYEKNKDKVNDMYNGFIYLIDNYKDICIENFEKIINYYGDLTDILYNNYVIPKIILKKELNKIEYIDFIYKIAVFSYIKREYKNSNITDLKELKNKINNAYIKIKNDEEIKIYEKVLLLINIYLSDFFENDNEINYFYIKKIDKNSPLALSIKFLNEFIEELDYNSNFYYPLLLIDGGLFSFKYKYDTWLNTFGANMNTIEDIKKHLKNLIPDIIVYSDNFKNKEATGNYAYTIPQIGIITLNTKLIGANYDMKEDNENIRKHKAFKLSRILFHELFGHKKSALNKDEKGIIILSANCFKDETNGIFRFLPDENNEYLFKNIDELHPFDIIESRGDSGYFLEYYFGKINNEYIVDIIDELEDKINLGVLLDNKLWHNKIDIFKEYITLKKYIHDNNIELIINENNNIFEQIQEIKKFISENKNYIKNSNFIIDNKIKNNFFIENKDELFNKKIKKIKKPAKHTLFGNDKKPTFMTLLKEAINPYDFKKFDELHTLYPDKFKKY